LLAAKQGVDDRVKPGHDGQRLAQGVKQALKMLTAFSLSVSDGAYPLLRCARA